MPLLISAVWAAIKVLPFSSQRQWDPFVSCQHKPPVIGGPEVVQYWISAVLLHTVLAMVMEGSGSPRGNGCWIHRSLLVLQWPTIQILKGEERRKDRQRLWGPSGSWDGCGRLIPARCQVPTKAALSLPSSAGQGGEKKTKVSWVKGRKKSLANDHHGQKRLHLGKLV